MPSPLCELAINQSLAVGKALVKTISPNDVGLTGSHQCGYYLPKQAWTLFSPFPPTRGTNNDHPVRIKWPDGCETESMVKWYGQGTRSEYRLTRFGRDFPFLTDDCVGNLLVIIPERPDYFYAFVFDLEVDIEDILSALGLNIINGWAVYEQDASPHIESHCIDERFRLFTQTISGFPSTALMSGATHETLLACIRGFTQEVPDKQLMRLIEAEYNLFKLVERIVCGPDIVRVFSSVDDFLKTAQSILQRRKARAGASLEHHTAFLLRNAGIPFDIHPCVDDTEPDILVPNRAAYYDLNYPPEKLFVLGLKTTCKDRWRQVTQEAPRIPHKHILTLQRGVSSNQLAEMKRCNVSLVVPSALHEAYPQGHRDDLLAVTDWVQMIKSSLGI